MPFDVLATLTHKALAPFEHRRIQFIWHGGEPLLLGRGFYMKALRLQQEFRQPGQMITNSLQTNGTLVTDDWCEFFQQYGFSIGLSLDGPPETHDANRVYGSGRGSFSDVEQAISLFHRHKIPFGALMVLNRRSISCEPRRILRFFLDLGVKSFAFLPARPDNILETGGPAAPDYVPPAEYVAFMKGIFEEWYALDDPSVQIRELNSIVSALVGGSASICTLAGDCLGQYFHVEADGSLYHCDKFLGDQRYLLGNVMRESFSEIRGSSRFHDLVSDERSNIATLNRCPFFHICRGGCPHDRYIAEKYLPGYDGSCCGQRDLIEFVRERVARDSSTGVTASPAVAPVLGCP